MRNIKNYLAELHRINKELKSLPKGHIRKVRTSYIQVVEENKKRKEQYITKQPVLLKQLARKRYLLARKEQLNFNLNLKAKNFDQLDTRTPQQLIAELPKAYQSLPHEYFYHELADTWLNPAPPKSSQYDDQKIHKSTKGVLFQSKSEAFIASQLEDYGFLYIPDQPLSLNAHTKYWPDFTILNPYNGRIIFWEHLGATHKEKYKEDMNTKMRNYFDAGYKPGENIIYTFESDTSRPERIKTLIETTLLPTL